jgi:hypothetical protein
MAEKVGLPRPSAAIPWGGWNDLHQSLTRGEFGTVEQTNGDDALVKWDDDGRMRLHQPWLKKVGRKAHPLPSQQVH